MPSLKTSKARAGRPLILSQFLPYRLSVLSECISSAFADRYEKRFGLSIPEWRIMAILGENAPRLTRDVIRQTQMDRVRVSRAVIRLSDKGLLVRTAHPTDQRAQILKLSVEGRKIYRQIVPLAQHLQRDFVQSLTSEEARALDAILIKLHASAQTLRSKI